MRRISPNRRKLLAEVSPVRQSLIERVGRCEFCGRHDVWLIAHEILRGSMRSQALGKPFAQLVLCDGIGDFCHELMDGKPLAMQLAILKRSRPEDLNLLKFHTLAKRNYPDYAAVDLWSKRLAFVSS